MRNVIVTVRKKDAPRLELRGVTYREIYSCPLEQKLALEKGVTRGEGEERERERKRER